MRWINTEVSARTGMHMCAHMCVVSENVWASYMFVCVVHVCIVCVVCIYCVSVLSVSVLSVSLSQLCLIF